MAHSRFFWQLIRHLQEARRLNLEEENKPAPIQKKQLSRRNVLKTAGVGLGLTITGSSCGSSPITNSRGTTPKIAIIGAGLAGLNAAYQLKKQGIKAKIFEASARIGGRILTKTKKFNHPIIADLGGSYINSDHEDLISLANEFNLPLFNLIEDENKSDLPSSAYFLEDQKLFDSDIASLLRPIAQQISEDSDLLDEDWDHYAPMIDQLSVKDYLDKHQDKIPVPYIRTLLENGIRTEYGVEPHESTALQLLYNLPTVNGQHVDLLGGSDETYMMEGGSGQLTKYLGYFLKRQIKKNKALTHIRKIGQAYELTFNHHETYSADIVILALPFKSLKQVQMEIDIPPTLKSFIHETQLSRNEKIISEFDYRVWRTPDGFHNTVWTDLGFSQAWEETQRQPELTAAAITFFFGGREIDKMKSGRLKKQGRKWIKELEKIIPGAEMASTDQFVRTHWTQNPFIQGGYTTFQPGQYTKFSEYLYIESDDPEEAQNVNVGGLIFAGEHLSDEFYGYMNGAAQTGRLAATSAIKQLQHQVMA